MSIQQYTFQVLLKESVESLSEEFIFLRGKDGFDDEPFWKFKPINKSFFLNIKNILKICTSWSNEIDLYGNQDSNCFEVWYDGESNNVISASFRIDFISDYESILSRIIEFCILNGLIILDEDLNRVPLNFESVKNIIDNAPQVKRYNELSGEKECFWTLEKTRF